MSNFFVEVSRQCTTILSSILGYTGINEEVTYRLYTGQTIVNKARVDNYSGSTVTGLKAVHTFKSAQISSTQAKGSGTIQAGDVLYIFAYNDLPTTISLKDLIIDSSGKTCRIKSILPIFNIANIVTIEKG